MPLHNIVTRMNNAEEYFIEVRFNRYIFNDANFMNVPPKTKNDDAFICGVCKPKNRRFEENLHSDDREEEQQQQQNERCKNVLSDWSESSVRKIHLKKRLEFITVVEY